MATMQLSKEYSWVKLPQVNVKQVMPINTLLGRLAKLRAEWLEAAESEGKTLFEIKASVGLLLYDFCILLELTSDEIEAVLGSELGEVIQ